MSVIYKSGTLTVPGATGSQTITGVGFQVKGVLFIGSNEATQDAVVTRANLGAFIGLASVDWDTASILQHSVSVIPNPKGSVLTARAIHIRATPGGATPDYSATVTSLNADGFTLNWLNVAATTRRVHYLAWGQGATTAHFGSDKLAAADRTLALGWRARGLFALGHFDGGDGEAVTVGTHWLYCGSGAYPSAGTNFFQGMSLTCASSGQQVIRNQVSPFTAVAVEHPQRAGVAGTVLGGDLRIKPTGGSLTDLLCDYVSVASSFDMIAFHDGEAVGDSVTSAAALNGTSVEALANTAIDQVAAVVFFTTGDTNTSGTTLTGNVGFGITTETHQACVMVDGSAQSIYQSSTKGFCDDVQAGGAHAGTVALGNEQFTLTTTVAGGGTANQMVYIAFGPSEAVTFIPQFFRRVPL